MAPSARPSRDASVWEWIAAALAAAAVWAAGGHWGAAVSPDSTIYLSAAENLARGRGLITFDGEPLVRWAPLYPALLALARQLGADALTAARVLGALGMAGVVLLAAVWLRRHVSSRALGLWALAAIACSSALLRDALFVWSEIPFLLFLYAALIDLERYVEAPGRATLVRAAIWAALASLIRYAGVSAGLAGLVVVLVAGGRRRVGDALLFGLVALAPLALWLARNVAVTGTLAGASAPPADPAWRIVMGSLEVMGKEWLPGAVPGVVRALTALGFLGFFAWAVLRVRSRAVIPAAAWLALYAMVLLVWASRSSVESINQRYLSPALVPAFVLGTRALEGALPTVARHRWLRRAAIALGVVWIGLSAARAGAQLGAYYRAGNESYTAPEWRASELARGLKREVVADTIYSNAPDAVYFLAGVPAKFSPRRTYYGSNRAASEDLPIFEKRVAREPVALAWFEKSKRPFVMEPDELRARFEVAPERRYVDGDVYRVRTPKRK